MARERRISTPKTAALLSQNRKEQGLSVYQVADVLGIIPFRYQQYERGTTAPALNDYPLLKSISQFLHISLDHLFLTLAGEKGNSLVLINRRIGEIRVRLGVTPEDFAAALAITHGAYQLFEMGYPYKIYQYQWEGVFQKYLCQPSEALIEARQKMGITVVAMTDRINRIIMSQEKTKPISNNSVRGYIYEDRWPSDMERQAVLFQFIRECEVSERALMAVELKMLISKSFYEGNVILSKEERVH